MSRGDFRRGTQKSSGSTQEMFQGGPPPQQQQAEAPAQYQNQAPVDPQRQGVKQWLAVVKNESARMSKNIEAVLPRGHSAERFLTTAQLYIRSRPELWGLDVPSLMQSFIRAAQQGLDFGIPNEAHIVPFKGKAALVRGYKGDLKMARRSPDIQLIDCEVVYENDRVEIVRGSDPKLIHTQPSFGTPRGPTVGFYAIAKDTKGNTLFITMDNEQCWTHAKRFTRATNKGPFAGVVDKGPAAENWEAYGRKTVIHAICNQKLDLFSEMAPDIEREGRILRNEVDVESVDLDGMIDASSEEQEKEEPKAIPEKTEPAKKEPPAATKEEVAQAQPRKEELKKQAQQELRKESDEDDDGPRREDHPDLSDEEFEEYREEQRRG